MKPRKADESRWMSFKNSGHPLSTVFLRNFDLETCISMERISAVYIPWA